jgi:hypothetical protein
MKQEFITTNGKVIIDDGVIHVKKLIHRSSGEYNFLTFWAFYCLYAISTDSKANPLLYILMGLVAFVFLIICFEKIFIKSWKKKFPMKQVKSYKVDKDASGLETTVTFFLKSGRQKSIVFRNHEKQLDPFIEMVTQHLTQTQFAH